MKTFTLRGTPSPIKYFCPDNDVILKTSCPKCKKVVSCCLGEFDFPAEQEEVYFCCEDCNDYEFRKKITLISERVEYIFTVQEEVEIDGNI